MNLVDILKSAAESEKGTRSISLLKLSPSKDSADPEAYYLAVTVL